MLLSLRYVPNPKLKYKPKNWGWGIGNTCEKALTVNLKQWRKYALNEFGNSEVP